MGSNLNLTILLVGDYRQDNSPHSKAGFHICKVGIITESTS